MNRKQFLRFCSDYRGGIERNLRVAARSADVDALHDLRVAIKRLRAVMRVFDAMVTGELGKRSLRPLRDLFRAAGAIRDMQVQQRIATEHAMQIHALDHYVSVLRIRQGEAFYRFLVAAEEFDARSLGKIEKLAARGIEKVYTVGAVWSLTNYLDGLIDRITAQWQPRSLHPLRIMTKEADNSMYVIERIVPSLAIDPHVHELLSKMQELLGLWQDQNVAIAFSRDYEPRDEPEHLAHRKFRRDVRRHRRKLQDQVFALWRELREARGIEAIGRIDEIPAAHIAE